MMELLTWAGDNAGLAIILAVIAAVTIHDTVVGAAYCLGRRKSKDDE